jgi:hypothetical protein
MSNWEINEDNNDIMLKSIHNEEKSISPIGKKEFIPALCDFDKIIFKETNDIDLLRYENYLFGYIRQYVKRCNENNDNINYQNYITYLKWIENVSIYFCKKLNLKIFTYDIKFDDTLRNLIPRSSYKFCNNSCDCEYNYKKSGRRCKGRHYVHELVFADINILIQYLTKSIVLGYSFINHNEVLKSINTISYVVNHMYNELSSFQYYGMTNIDELHKDCGKNKK